MSQVKADLISNAAGTSYPTFVKADTIRVWGCINMTGTMAIRSSFGVSAVTDSGVGFATYNLTNAMANTDFNSLFSPGGTAAVTGHREYSDQLARLVSRVSVAVFNTSAALTDCAFLSGQVAGALA